MLEKNYNKMGMFPKGSTLEWWTAKFLFFSIHVNTRDDMWVWQITGENAHIIKGERIYPTKELAYTAALNFVRGRLVWELDKVDGELNEN